MSAQVVPGRASIIVTSWNYLRFVAEAVDSALSQTHPDVEVIVVDDGSVDGSANLLRSYGDRIVLIEQANAHRELSSSLAFDEGTAD